MPKLVDVFDDSIRVLVLEYLLDRHLEGGSTRLDRLSAMDISRGITEQRWTQQKKEGSFTGRRVSHSSVRLALNPLVQQDMVTDTVFGGRFHSFNLNTKNRIIKMLLVFYERLTKLEE
ncbi:MAG: hypothetical protein ACXACA_02125 [Candidatus Ranarchaeia archaeon]